MILVCSAVDIDEAAMPEALAEDATPVAAGVIAEGAG
jgi:hypothetical protein